jgi:hypothetical protein
MKSAFPLAGGQNNSARSFQFQKEASAGHVFVLPCGTLPAPQPAEFYRQMGTAPLGIGGKQCSDMLDVVLVYGCGLFHAQ